MGAIAEIASVPEDVWPAVLPSIRAAGIEVTDGEWERRVWWYDCSRGPSRVGLAYCPEERGCELVVYCAARHFWRRPVGMWLLLREVRRAVLAAGGKPA
jgi:hypothetical protein